MKSSYNSHWGWYSSFLKLYMNYTLEKKGVFHASYIVDTAFYEAYHDFMRILKCLSKYLNIDDIRFKW